MAESALRCSLQPAAQECRPHFAATTTAPQSHQSSPPTHPVQTSQHNYNFSPRACEESSATEYHNESTDEDVKRLNAGTVSSCSSVSSLPASVAPSGMVLPQDAKPHASSSKLHGMSGGSLNNELNGPRWRNSPFRNPSSVRSMQMRDEDEAIPHRRQRISRLSGKAPTFSALASGVITPQKNRRSGKDRISSPRNVKVKKEFPLVLLHCSLLPPAMPIRARISDAALLQAVLPEEYLRRWELLTDKITNDIEVQSRGVLIPHPKADYELLEERLLESLELARPRLRSGHYYGNEVVHEVEESESDTETAVQGAKCQDCGKRVVEDIARDRKWDVKVYAANGLMRAGAWSAAWKEMEKVDVEVSICLPRELRKEVEERCVHLGIGHEIEADEEQEYECIDTETRTREIYGTPRHDPHETGNGFSEPTHLYDKVQGEPFASQHQGPHHASAPTIELKQLFINHIIPLAQDKRNLVIAVLSLAVVFLSLHMSTSSGQTINRSMTRSNSSTPSLQPVTRCITNPISSVSTLAVVPPASSVSVPTSSVTSTVTSTDCEAPAESTSAAELDLQVPFLSEDQEPGDGISREG